MMFGKLKYWLRYGADSMLWALWVGWFSVANFLYSLFNKHSKSVHAKKILVLHNMRVGDTVAITPLLHLLKSKLTGAVVDVVTSQVGAEVLNCSPDVGSIFIFKPKSRMNDYLNLVGKLREKRYDATIDLSNGFSDWGRELLAVGSGSPCRVSFKRCGYHAACPTHEIEYEYLHAVDVYLKPSKVFGLKPDLPDRKYRIALSEQEKSWGKEKIESLGGKSPVLILNPTTLDPNKQWLPSRFALVADRLINEVKASVIITAAPEESHLAREVSAMMKAPHHQLAGQTSLREYLSLIAASQLVLTVDTAAVHAAQAFNVPVVALFNPATCRYWGPLPGSKSSVLVKPDVCEKCWKLTPCGRSVWEMKCTKQSRQCMEAISAEEVFIACRNMLGVR
jgi:ADP-heptose:LPS heptosyltransferase